MTWKLAFVYFPSLLFLPCVSLGSVKCGYSNFPKVGHFPFVFRGMDRLRLSLSSVFFDGRSLGWLWRCKWTSSSSSDDKWFFRKLRSLPLGGAIPSAASPEEADTLEQRDGSGNKAEWWAHAMWLVKIHQPVSLQLSLRTLPELQLCFKQGIVIPQVVLILQVFSVLSWSLSVSVPVTPKVAHSSSCLACWSCAIWHATNSFNFPLMLGLKEMALIAGHVYNASVLNACFTTVCARNLLALEKTTLSLLSTLWSFGE